MSDATTLVRDSYTRSMGKDIIGRFYEIFLKSHPDVAPMFVKTDFAMQKKLLSHGIQLAIMFAEENVLGESGVTRIRKSHSKSKLSIPPHLYVYWKASFLQAVSETDSDFSPEIREAWDDILQRAITYIVEGFDATQ